MRIHHNSWRQVSMAGVAALGLLLSSNTQAATISGGAFTLNIDRDALIAASGLDTYPDNPTPEFQVCCRSSMYLEEFYSGAAADVMTFNEMVNVNTPDLYDMVSDEIPATNLAFAVVDGVAPPSPSQRSLHGTDFAFDPSDVQGTATGAIGLNGMMRFRVDVTPPGNRVLIGDFTLSYDPSAENYDALYDIDRPGKSGWTLTNYAGWQDIAFDLLDVTTSIDGDQLSINGNIGIGSGLVHLSAYDSFMDMDRIGSFSFQTTVVPVPGAVWLFLSGVAGVFMNGRRRKMLG